MLTRWVGPLALANELPFALAVSTYRRRVPTSLPTTVYWLPVAP
jgi:hypothetical protein